MRPVGSGGPRRSLEQRPIPIQCRLDLPRRLLQAGSTPTQTLINRQRLNVLDDVAQERVQVKRITNTVAIAMILLAAGMMIIH